MPSPAAALLGSGSFRSKRRGTKEAKSRPSAHDATSAEVASSVVIQTKWRGSNMRRKWRAARGTMSHALAFSLPVPDPPGTYKVEIDGLSRTRGLERIPIVQSTVGQHTIAWKKPLVDDDGTTLPAGECNLYAFPRCNLGKRVGVVPDDMQLVLLFRLLKLSALPSKRLFFRRDSSGACPIHALLIANNPEALSLCLQVYAQVPSLLMQTHGPGFFAGESGLHVLAANRREAELCEALDLAEELLTTPQLSELLCVKCVGDFFRSPPSLFYGATILGYAASFNLKEATGKILSNQRIAREIDLLNDPSLACKITGFLPLHAAVANGVRDMVDFLVGREGQPALDGITPLPEERRAERNTKTPLAEKLEWGGLSSLQLAAKLGDQAMCKHLLRERLTMNWKWGPLTSLSLSLNEIESAYEKDSGLMELVAHFDARPATQSMLLDEFLQGFLHKLFVQKWHRFGKHIFYTLRAVDLAFLVLLLVLAFRLKGEPMQRSIPLAIATLALGALSMLLELWVLWLWWSNEFGSAASLQPGRQPSSNLRHKFNALRLWASGFGVGKRLVASVLTIIGCVLYILATNAGRVDANGSHDEPLWTLFAISAAFQTHALIGSIFVSPNIQELGVYSITIDRMFAHDVQIFLVFMAAFMLMYWLAMYISFPRAGTDTLPEIAPFDDPLQSFKAVLDASIYQVRFSTNWDAIDPSTFSPSRWVAMVLFSYFHLMFAITCLLLLVRLLMAMMTNTFQSVRKQAQLEWRLLIARHVLRLELVFTAFVKSPLRVLCCSPRLIERKFSGDIPPGDTTFVHTFLHVERSPDAEAAVPLLLAQQGGQDLYDAAEQQAVAALKAKREASAKEAPWALERPAAKGLAAAIKTRVAHRTDADGATGTQHAESEVDSTEVDKAADDREQLKALLASALALLDAQTSVVPAPPPPKPLSPPPVSVNTPPHATTPTVTHRSPSTPGSSHRSTFASLSKATSHHQRSPSRAGEMEKIDEKTSSSS